MPAVFLIDYKIVEMFVKCFSIIGGTICAKTA